MLQRRPIAIQKFLRGLRYPAHTKEVLQHARAKGSPPDLMDVLEALLDRSFSSPVELSAALAVGRSVPATTRTPHDGARGA